MQLDPRLPSALKVRATRAPGKVVAPCSGVSPAQAAAPPLVFEAAQFSSIRQGTTYGKIPYRVSLTECEWRSTAQNTCTQNRAASSTSTTACQVTGRYTQPHETNQRRCTMIHLPRARITQSSNARGIGKSVSPTEKAKP